MSHMFFVSLEFTQELEQSPLSDLQAVVASLQENFEAQRHAVDTFADQVENIERERSRHVSYIYFKYKLFHSYCLSQDG